MRFLCLQMLWGATLLALGCCDDKYRAEVYVVASNPQEYGVSVASSTYPTVVVNTNQDADDPKPQAVPFSSTSSSSSSLSPDNNSTPLTVLSNPPSDNPYNARTISTSETPLYTSTHHMEPIPSPTRDGTNSHEAEVSLPSLRDRTDAPVTSARQSSAAQQMPGDTFDQTSKGNNNQCMRNVRSSTGGTRDMNSETNLNLNGLTTRCSMPPKNISSCQTQPQGEHRTPFNYTETKRVNTNGITTNETGATQLTPNISSASQGITNQHSISMSELPQQAQSNHPTTIQQALNDEKRSQDQQILTNPGGTNERSPISQSANIQQPRTNETGGHAKAVINQLVVLPSHQADKTGNIPEFQIDQTNITTPSTSTGVKEAPNNQTKFNQIEIPAKTETIHEILTNQTRFNQTTTRTLPTGFNQTQSSTNQTGNSQEIPSNEKESLLSEIRKLENRKTYSPRSLNQTQRERELQRRLEERRRTARERSASITNQTEPTQKEVLDKESNETSLLRTFNQNPRSLNRGSERRMPRRNLRRRKRIRKPGCTCVEEVIARTAKCKRPCSKTAQVTNVLFYRALVIWVVYVVLLALSYRRFCHNRREEEEWRRNALRWKCRERRMRWLIKMFS